MTQEGRIASLLLPVDIERLERLNAAELAEVRSFVFLQRERTLAAAQEARDLNAAIVAMLREYRMGGTEEELRAMEEEPPISQRLARHAAMDSSSVIADLEVKFLVPSRHASRGPSRAFVIGDAPVSSYNQWAEHHTRFRDYTGHQGIACKGLQWFYPFAPGLCVCVFDPTTYAYGSSSGRVCTASVRDVRFLNLLQAIHAVDCVYYLPGRTHDDELDPLCRARASHARLRVPTRIEGPMSPRPDGTSSQIVGWTQPDARVGARFQFVRVVDVSGYEGYDVAVLPPRSPDVIRAVEERLRRRWGPLRPLRRRATEEGAVDLPPNPPDR